MGFVGSIGCLSRTVSACGRIGVIGGVIGRMRG
jgi:hypothetical protein